MQVAQTRAETIEERPNRSPAISRFRRDRDGATAVEFSLLAMPVLVTLLATMEIAMIMWQDQLLQNVVSKVSREIYTGQTQTDVANATLTAAQIRQKIKDAVCKEGTGFIPCDTTLQVDVREISSFSEIAPSPITATKTYSPSYDYKPVGPNKIGLVTVSFVYKTFFPPMAGTTLATGDRVIMATAAFRAQPY